MSTTTTVSLVSSIQNVNDRLVVGSRRIAELFEKDHKNVMQSIRELIDADAELGRLDFQPSEYLNSQGKSQPEFLMTEEGFMLLGMGFNGAKALSFKRALIAAFREMRDSLQSRNLVLPADPLEGMELMLGHYKQERQLRIVAEAKTAEAVRTKAWISDKKTATAMGTASAASKRATEAEEAAAVAAAKASQLEAVALEAPLTAAEIVQLDAAIASRGAQLNLSRTDTYRFLRGALKKRFLPAALATSATYKDMARKDLTAALAFVAVWVN